MLNHNWKRLTNTYRHLMITVAVSVLLAACSNTADEVAMETVDLPAPFLHVTHESTSEGTFQVIVLEPTPILSPVSITESSPPTATDIPSLFSGEVLANANCRSGPGTGYPITRGFAAGEKAELVGISPDKKWWVVRTNQQGSQCWISGNLLAVDPRAQDLPVFPVPSTPVPTVNIPSDVQFELALLELINQVRANAGLSVLTMEPRLVTAARTHSNDMATNDFFDHTGTGQTSFEDRIADEGYQFSAAGETLCAGGSVETCVQFWLDSPTHRETLLSPAFMHVGIGVVWASDSMYQVYITADYGSP